MGDITLRGSGELMHLIKDKVLSIEEISIYCNLIWTMNENAECAIKDISKNTLEKLSNLNLLKIIDNKTVMLNPHVTGVGGPKKRGELRLKFKKFI